MPPKHAHRALYTDIRRTAAVLAIAAFTSLCPKSYDAAIVERIYRLLRPLRSRRRAKMVKTLAEVHESIPRSSLSSIADQRNRLNLELLWSGGRTLGVRAAGPQFDIRGLSNLNDAIAKGRGAILWRLSFGSASAINAALAQQGFPVTHLSTPFHLCHSEGRFARWIASPLFSRDEARFLLERVVMEPGRATGYFHRLKSALEQNRPVSIVGDADRGRIRESIPLGNRSFNVPSGAPSLAYSSGAPLLPCVAIRIAPFQYRVEIFADVAPQRDCDRRQFRREAIKRYSELRQHLSAEYPASDLFF